MRTPQQIAEAQALVVVSFTALWTLIGISIAVNACGGSAPDITEACPPSVPLTDRERAVYAEIQRCTGLTAPEPRIRHEPPGTCNNGRSCCIAAKPDRYGEYAYTCGILIVTSCPAPNALRHEAVHHLKFVVQGDLSHDGPEWACA